MSGIPTGHVKPEGESANASTLEITTPAVTCTDPPYYDNVSYADLADFFYVWLRRSLGSIYPDLMGTMLTQKADQLVADPVRHEGKKNAQEFFEAGFTDVFANIREATPENYPITVFYAFKQAEHNGTEGQVSTGWEELLEGMLRSGWA